MTTRTNYAPGGLVTSGVPVILTPAEVAAIAPQRDEMPRTCPDTRNAPKGPQTGAQAAKRADWLDRLATDAPCTTSAALLRAWADDLRAIAPRMKESQ